MYLICMSNHRKSPARPRCKQNADGFVWINDSYLLQLVLKARIGAFEPVDSRLGTIPK
jgi:hypothetical protein